MKDDDKILKGFNSGYEIASKDMTLAKTMAEAYKGKRTDFVVAFEQGIQEYELEMQPQRATAKVKESDELER